MSDYSDYEKVVRAWERAEPVLQKLREKEIRETDTVQAMKILSSAIDSAILHSTSRDYSGLIEQQRWFRLLAR